MKFYLQLLGTMIAVTIVWFVVGNHYYTLVEWGLTVMFFAGFLDVISSHGLVKLRAIDVLQAAGLSLVLGFMWPMLPIIIGFAHKKETDALR